MATGDCTLTNYGTYDVSGAALKTAVDGVNLGSTDASGARLFLIPTASGQQVQVLKVSMTAW